MSKGKHDQVDMRHGPLLGKLILFALPLALSSILQQLFNAVDIAVLGQFATSQDQAAVGCTSAVINMFLNLFLGISVGANVVIATYIGQRDKEKVQASVHTAMLIALISGFVMMLVGFVTARPILELIQTPESVLDKAVLYLLIYFAGMPFIMVYNFAAAILRSVGDTKRPLICLTVSGVLNAGLNIFLVAGPVQIISERYSSTIAASAVCKRVLAFLDEPTDEASGWGSQPLTRVETVSLRDISCRRGEREILKHVDLTLQKGDRIALLGESGAGKSTLLKVLAAMCGAEGEYTINGRPCHAYRYADFRRQVTLLAQKTFVFSASIRDNLTMFSGTAQQDEALVKTLAAAGLSEWYADRGASMDAAIGGEAHALSGGEERRLDLARTLWRQGSLVMLDEPTAGLDEKTRVELEKQIAQLPCDILIVAMHNYSPEFLDSFTKVLRIRDGELEP